MGAGRPLRRAARWIVVAGVSALAVLALFEGLYRIQLVDTYAPELRAYNPAATVSGDDDARPTALFMGDSFTAGAEGSYPADLRRLLPGARIVNAAISGTGIVQANIVAPERFAHFHPKVFVYQVYVGNDLFDIRYPVNLSRGSKVRMLYWAVADRLRSVAFVNYRLAQLRYQATHPGGTPPAPEEAFSVARFDARLKKVFAAEPGLVESSIMLQGARAGDFPALTRGLHRLLSRCAPGSCVAYVLVMPHCAQVTEGCLTHMKAVGAALDDSLATRGPGYPFVDRLRTSLGGVSNVTLLDPLDTLRDASREGTPLFKANDEHLNAVGYGVIASYLAPRLAASLGVETARH